MTAETTKLASWWTEWRAAVIVAFVALVAAGAWGLAAHANQQRESDQRSDEYYCTLSDVGPLDRAPKTGELCADLVDY